MYWFPSAPKTMKPTYNNSPPSLSAATGLRTQPAAGLSFGETTHDPLAIKRKSNYRESDSKTWYTSICACHAPSSNFKKKSSDHGHVVKPVNLFGSACCRYASTVCTTPACWVKTGLAFIPWCLFVLPCL